MDQDCSKSWSYHHFTYLLSWKKKEGERLATHKVDGLISAGFRPLIMGKRISIHGETLQESRFTFIFCIHALALKPQNSNPSR